MLLTLTEWLRNANLQQSPDVNQRIHLPHTLSKTSLHSIRPFLKVLRLLHHLLKDLLIPLRRVAVHVE